MQRYQETNTCSSRNEQLFDTTNKQKNKKNIDTINVMYYYNNVKRNRQAHKRSVVVAIHASSEEVIIVNTTGNKQRFYGVGYEDGNTVIMTMDKNNTDNIIQNVTVNTY